jgi:putative flippase GtrA
MQSSRKILHKQMLGFAITGTLSTVLMLVIYMALNKIINYQYAYLAGYCISVIALYFMNALWVFNNHGISLSTFLKFPLIYLLQYVIGAFFLEFIVRLGFSITYAPVVVVIILLPVTFVLNRIVLLKH